jgi:hypothetical protein
MYTKHGLDETRLGLWHGLTLFHPPIETLFKACRGSLRVGRYYKWIPTSCVQQPINRCMFGLLWGPQIPPSLSGSHDSSLFVDLSSGERRRCCWHDAAEVAVVRPR